MRVIHGAEEARRTLLQRQEIDEPQLSGGAQQTIRRVFGKDLSAADVVVRILHDVRAEGDAAVLRYSREIDGVDAASAQRPLAVSPSEIDQAHERVESSIVESLKFAAARIREFHERQLAHSFRSFEEEGLGQVVRPLRRVGLYVPGTTVVYPSTVLMIAVPARVAGVGELIMTTPANKDGSVSPLKLVAADIAGVSAVFRAGGVQGIGAMACGTESVPRVDKICGPGNIFVTLAKKQLYGRVGIDGIFGPSETLIIADERADAVLVSSDLLAGAEHDELATAVLITDSPDLAEAVSHEVDGILASGDCGDAAIRSMQVRGGAAVVRSLAEAIDLANEFAPEHLCLHLAEPETALSNVSNAGCVFVGAQSVESIGDYAAGPSHVMPTGGSAVYASPLGVHDFLKVTSLVRIGQEAVDAVGPSAAALAHAEGLAGHARAIERRITVKQS